MEKFEAIIIGGGPAGSTAGILLARKNWNVLIIERLEFPAEKIFGGVLLPAAWPFLDALGASDLLRMYKGSEINSIGFVFPPAKEIKVAFTADKNGSSFSGYGIS